MPPGPANGEGGVVVGASVALFLEFLYGLPEFLVRPGLVVAVVDAVAREVAPLALTRRVIHEGDKPEHRAVADLFEESLHAVVRQFAAQVQVVIRAQHARAAGFRKGGDGSAHHGHAALVIIFAHAHGVADRGDARGDDLGVVGEDSGTRVGPVYLRTGHEVLFEVVRMKLDNAGNEVIPLQIDDIGA